MTQIERTRPHAPELPPEPPPPPPPPPPEPAPAIEPIDVQTSGPTAGEQFQKFSGTEQQKIAPIAAEPPPVVAPASQQFTATETKDEVVIQRMSQQPLLPVPPVGPPLPRGFPAPAPQIPNPGMPRSPGTGPIVDPRAEPGPRNTGMPRSPGTAPIIDEGGVVHVGPITMEGARDQSEIDRVRGAADLLGQSSVGQEAGEFMRQNSIRTRLIHDQPHVGGWRPGNEGWDDPAFRSRIEIDPNDSEAEIATTLVHEITHARRASEDGRPISPSDPKYRTEDEYVNAVVTGEVDAEIESVYFAQQIGHRNHSVDLYEKGGWQAIWNDRAPSYSERARERWRSTHGTAAAPSPLG